jgi:MFS family permease
MSTQASQPSQRIFTKGYARILAIQMAFGVSYSTFLLLPKFLRTELSASATQIGAMAGTALVVGAVLSPLVGLFAHRFDRRWLLALALLFEGLAAMGFLFVKDIGPYAYALRVIQGTAWVFVFNCTATLVADQVPQAHLGRAVGYLGLAMLTTNALAPAVAEPLAAVYGWHAAFGASGILALLALFIVPSIESAKSPSAAAIPTASGPAPSRLPIHYASLLIGAGLGVLFTFIQPFALEQGAKRVGDFFFGYVAAAFFVRAFLGGVSDRIGHRKVASVAMALYALVTASAALVTPSTLALVGVGLGISHGFIYPSLSAAGLSETPAKDRALFMGWFACAFNVGCAFTSLVLGPVADRFGYPLIFAATGVWMLTGIAPLLGLRARRAATIRPAE